MKRSTDRILTSHTGMLNLPNARRARARSAMPLRFRRMSTKRCACRCKTGIDVINDGQQGGVGSLDLTYGRRASGY